MYYRFQKKIQSFWRKNSEEIIALLTGQMPHFLPSLGKKKSGKEVPVFCFHSVEPARFENQLKYLRDNNYSTVGSDELFLLLNSNLPIPEKTVVLTFDDATGSFWATAFPLLKKYEMQAILFVVPGIVPEKATRYPNLDDVWAGNCSAEEILLREEVQSLCTWDELRIMHESGYIDIQSHSFSHSRIHISPRIVDYIHPGFDANFYDNVNIPISVYNKGDKPIRNFLLGTPVYESASRMTDTPRFFEDLRITEELISFVGKNGGEKFFEKSSWKDTLDTRNESLTENKTHMRFESKDEQEDVLRYEFSQSKCLLESNLSNKTVSHFCYPWFQGSPVSDKIAHECGYQTVFYGLIPISKNHPRNMPIKIRRISEDFLFCLPGQGRAGYLSIWLNKVRKKMNVAG